MNVENLDHVVKGLTRWHDETHVVQNFIQGGTDPNGTWVPKQGGTGDSQGLGTFANSGPSPNCKRQVCMSGIWLVSTKPIMAGSEIMPDYSLYGGQTLENTAQESRRKVSPMQLEYTASRKYDDCNRKLSDRYLDEYKAPARRKFCIQLIPTPVDETNMKDFTVAHSLTVTALGQWQGTNGNTQPEDTVPDEGFSACLQAGPYMRVRCDMAPELDKKEIGPWFGDFVFGEHSKFQYATGATKESEKPVIVGMALACHTEATGRQKIGEMDLPANGRHGKGGPYEVDYSPTMVWKCRSRETTISTICQKTTKERQWS